jgi:hypothetical protein
VARNVSRRQILRLGAAAIPGLSGSPRGSQRTTAPLDVRTHYLQPLREVAEALEADPTQTLEGLNYLDRILGGGFRANMVKIIEWAAESRTSSAGISFSGRAAIHLPSGSNEGSVILTVLIDDRALVAHRITKDTRGDRFPATPSPADRAGVFRLNETGTAQALYTKAEAAIERERVRGNRELRRSPIFDSGPERIGK